MAVSRSFEGSSTLLTAGQAGHEAVENAIWDASHLHFACHGRFDPDHSLKTGLLLAGGEYLTVEDLLDRQSLAEVGKPGARLVVLSACQSALTEFRRVPDEAIGLPSVFLQAGAPGVVGTLWQVDDLSTALLMIRFYELSLSGSGDDPMPPARALRQAQLWLRDTKREELLAFFREQRSRHDDGAGKPMALLDKSAIGQGIARLAWEEDGARPFSEPYYWAPFVFVGL
jgi:CHAT domain-containing protein